MAGEKPRPKAVEQQRRKRLNFELFEFGVRISRFGFPTPLLAQRHGWHDTDDDTEVMKIAVLFAQRRPVLPLLWCVLTADILRMASRMLSTGWRGHGTTNVQRHTENL